MRRTTRSPTRSRRTQSPSRTVSRTISSRWDMSKRKAAAIGALWRNLAVYLRIRPFSQSEIARGDQNCFKVVSDTQISLSLDSDEADGSVDYFFTKVFNPRASQLDVFDTVCAPQVRKALQGENALVFVYGVTNSGKTHTMEGTASDPGIFPRSMDFLFSHLAFHPGIQGVTISFLEIYQKKVIDLLAGEQKSLQFFSGPKKQVFIKNLTEAPIRNFNETINLWMKAKKRRKVFATDLNDKSSRGHFVITIDLLDASDPKKKTKLCFVDLGGIERVKKAGSTGDRLVEASSINSAMTVLSKCLRNLQWNQRHPNGSPRTLPFRESCLTRIFEQFICSHGSSSMILNVYPGVDDFSEKMVALDNSAIARQLYAKVVMPGQGSKTRGIVADDNVDLQQKILSTLQRQVEMLRNQVLEQRQKSMAAAMSSLLSLVSRRSRINPSVYFLKWKIAVLESKARSTGSTFVPFQTRTEEDSVKEIGQVLEDSSRRLSRSQISESKPVQNLDEKIALYDRSVSMEKMVVLRRTHRCRVLKGYLSDWRSFCRRGTLSTRLSSLYRTSLLKSSNPQALVSELSLSEAPSVSLTCSPQNVQCQDCG